MKEMITKEYKQLKKQAVKIQQAMSNAGITEKQQQKKYI